MVEGMGGLTTKTPVGPHKDSSHRDRHTRTHSSTHSVQILSNATFMALTCSLICTKKHTNTAPLHTHTQSCLASSHAFSLCAHLMMLMPADMYSVLRQQGEGRVCVCVCVCVCVYFSVWECKLVCVYANMHMCVCV